MQADSKAALEAAGFRAGSAGWEIPLPERGNIAELCVGRHARGPLADRVALIAAPAEGPERSYSYAELDRLANALAAGLIELGVRVGEPVGVFTGQRAETVVIHLALYKLGAVAATLSQLYGPDTLGHIFADCGLRYVFAERALWEKTTAGIAGGQALPTPIFIEGEAALSYARLAASDPTGFVPRDTALNDPAILMYTSGSTGLPKGLLHAHRVLFAYMPTVRLFYNLETARPDLVFWTPADWAWVGGLLDLLLPALAEGQTVLASDIRFTSESAFALMARHRVSHLFMTPTGLKRLAEVARPKDRWELRLSTVCTGGESVPSEVVRWCNQALGAACNEFYGLTEFNHLVGNSSAVFPVRPGSMGRPYPGHRTTIVDESGRELPNGEIGEIVAHESDPALFLGYWGRPGVPDALRLGPWLRTRDLAYRDDEGYFWYQGRNDDLIKSAGYRIGPAEVEDMLVAHPAVAEAAVIGKPDPKRGTIVKAFVRLHANHNPSDVLVVELQHHVKTRLAAYKYPREIEFVESFPLTSSGKIRRGELRQRELEKAKRG